MTGEECEQDREAVRIQWREAIGAAGSCLLRSAVVEVPANSSGWVDGGVDLNIGEAVTLLAAGKVLTQLPGIGFGANMFLWHRIGTDGPIAKFPASTQSFEARQAGRLMLVAQFPGAWLDQAGGLAPDWPRQAAGGSFTVAVLVWKDRAEDGLALFAAKDRSRFAAAEYARFTEPAQPPKGWQHLWRVGESGVYKDVTGNPQGRAPGTNEAPRIACRCRGGGGILKYPVDLPLDGSTRLSWLWRVIELPSQVAEDSLPTHDYLSIAVEFDNGQDLTYLWSAALAVGTVFRCPLPWWDKHETHQVIRCGTAELGQWRREDQPVLADYAKAIGGTPPARIVGVWLIAVAAFQGGRGDCEYREIRLGGGAGGIDIGP